MTVADEAGGFRVGDQVLSILTIEEWNASYEGAMAFREAQRRGERPKMPEKFSADGKGWWT
jgi:hypothetical protein